MRQPRRATDGSPRRAPDTGQRARRRLLLALMIALCAGIGLAPAPAGASPEAGQWGPIVNWPTMGKHMVLMHDNRVLVFSTGANAHVWDLATNTFTPAPATFGDLHCAGHATLADGRVIVIGGVNVDPFIGINVTATFDPATSTWENKTPMRFARWYPTATTLADGQLLATSGTDQNKVKVTTPEVYDPGTDSWRTLTARTQPIYPWMYQLPNGKVFEAAPKSTTALLDTAGSGSWTPGPTSGWDNGNGCCSESGAMYGIGKIIRSGGNDPAIARTGTIDMTAASPQWTETAPMAFPRRRHNMVLLADGSVMAVGGTRVADDATQAVLAGEIWNPDTRAWTTVAAMSQPRMYHSAALLLPDGRVVAAGGDTPDAGKRTAQIYSPPYLFKGARPAITTSPVSAAYGGGFTVGTDTPGIDGVALIRPGAVTHAIDMNQRYVPLQFTQSGNELTVGAPRDGNVAPPGRYMLVIKNGNGVPSVARWIQIGGEGAPPPPPPPDGAPTASFTLSPAGGTAPLTVSFTDTSGGAPTSWAWDFQNDGVVDSTQRNPQFTYAAAGSYTVKLTVSNASGSDDEIRTSAVSVTDPSAPPGSTSTFSAAADARVQEANPTTNYGTSSGLRTDGGTDPDVESYLRFAVTGVGSVTSAKLRVYATTGSANGPAAYAVADTTWSETGITWSNRPARSAAADDKGTVAAGSFVEFDVTSLVKGNGLHTFALATTSSDGVDFSSREAATAGQRPQLVVTSGAAEPAPPIAGFTATPTSGTAPLTVRFTDTSVGAETWAWDFQNDQSFESTARNPEWHYTEPGTYTVRLQVENAVGGDEEIKTGYITVGAAEPPGQTLTLVPDADAKVRSSTPTRNYGTLTDLQVRLGNTTTPHTYRSYLKFTVRGLSGPPASAKLRLWVTDATKDGGVLHAVSNDWTETGITWNDAPAIAGTPLANVGSVALNSWKEIDVGAAITGDGTYSFAIMEGTSSDSALYSSREAVNGPQLVLAPGGGDAQRASATQGMTAATLGTTSLAFTSMSSESARPVDRSLVCRLRGR